MRSISELWNRHAGEMAWVVAAGPSAGFVDPEFFREKLTIGVNRVWKQFPVSYCVFKEQYAAEEAWKAGVRIITSLHHCGSLEYAEIYLKGGYYFEHEENHLEEVELGVIKHFTTETQSTQSNTEKTLLREKQQKIVVSYSTITSAMHVAAYMGAREIILVGHDCGTLDGEANYPGYGEPLMDKRNYEQWLGMIEPQTLMVKAKLEEVFGVRVYSLNPFVNFGLEGHQYMRGGSNGPQ